MNSQNRNSQNSFFEFALRPRILYKPGLVREMSNEISGLNVQRAFIVADAGVERAGLLDTVRAGLGSSVRRCFRSAVYY